MMTITDTIIREMDTAAGEAGDYGTCALAALALDGWEGLIDYVERLENDDDIRAFDHDDDADIQDWLDRWLPTVPRPLTMAQARATLAEQHQAFLGEMAEFADVLDAEDAMAEIEALPR